MSDAPGRLPYAAYLDALVEEADRITAALAPALEDPVPTCPGWRGRDLADHLVGVYRFFTRQLERADPTARAPVSDEGPPAEPIDALDAAVAALSATLLSREATAPCWNWSGQDLIAGWVARRMALETAVHRVDAERTAGHERPIERELAVDGLDERIAVHLVADVPEAPTATLGGSICLVCADDPAAFVVEVSGGRVRWRAGRGPADAVVVAPASTLLLFTWNRVGPEGLELTGDPAVVAAWSSLPV